MSYIVMGLDECGQEFRPSDLEHATYTGAAKEMLELEKVFVEARSLWVEEFRNADYWAARYEGFDDPLDYADWCEQQEYQDRGWW